MQLIWHGILLFDFRPSVRFLGRGSLLTLLMLRMMRVDILLGVHKDSLSLVLSKQNCRFGYSKIIFVRLNFSFFLITRYGDMPAHNLLWRACENSSDNVAARLAVIPLVQVISFSWLYTLWSVMSELIIKLIFAWSYAFLLFQVWFWIRIQLKGL